MGDSGNQFFLKCHKCGSWYTASCHWYRVYDKIDYQPKDKRGNPLPWKDSNGKLQSGPVEAMFPRIKIENVEPHDCEKVKKKYEV